MSKIVRVKNCECSFKYIEEFDSIETASNPTAEGVVIDVQVSNVRTVFTNIKQKEDLVGRTKISSAKAERSSREETSEGSKLSV